MVYDNTEWVAWIDEDVKGKQAEFYDLKNLFGTTNWAIDLQEWLDSSGGSSDGNDVELVYEDLSPYTAFFSTLKQLEDRKGRIPSQYLQLYIVDVQIAVFDGAIKKYKKLIDNGYDKKFSIWEG